MIAVLLVINIVLVVLLVRLLKSRDSQPRSTDADVPPVWEARPANAILDQFAGAESGALSTREAEIAAVVNDVRLVNVTPERYREKLREPVPSPSGPVLTKLEGPMAEYCDSDWDAALIVGRLRTADLLAIDIETTPKVIVPTECSNWSLKLRALHPKSADIRLIQVYDGGDSVHVFDLKRGVNLNTLHPLFQRPLIAHNAAFEKQFLTHQGIHPIDLRCTMQMAKKINPAARSLEAAAQYFLGARLNKSFQKTDWSVPELSSAQIKYAACDAWVCFLIYRQICQQHSQSATSVH